MSPTGVPLLFPFWVVNSLLYFPLIVVSFSPSVLYFRCMLHPLPLPLSSCLGCIPPLIGLPSLRFYAVGSSLFLLSVCFCLCSLFYRDDVLCWLLLARPFLYAFHAHLRFPVDLVWFRLSCDHGWIRSGSVNVRKQQQQQLSISLGSRSSHSAAVDMTHPRLAVLSRKLTGGAHS